MHSKKFRNLFHLPRVISFDSVVEFLFNVAILDLKASVS